MKKLTPTEGRILVSARRIETGLFDGDVYEKDGIRYELLTGNPVYCPNDDAGHWLQAAGVEEFCREYGYVKVETA